VYLNFVAQFPELVMNIVLLGLWFLTWPLELDQKRLPTRDPEDSIWVTSVARSNQFGVYDPEVFPRQVAGIPLYLRFFHGNLYLSRHGAQTP